MIVHEPLAIPMGDAHAFGILVSSEGKGTMGALVLPGAGNFGNGGPALLGLARHLAATGCATMRLDYLGMGESTGGITRLRAGQPRTTDPHAAVELLRQQGHANLALIGLCYGARVALETASDMPEVVGVVLLAPPMVSRTGIGAGWSIGSLLRRMARPSRWRNLLQREHRRTYAYVIRRFVTSRLPGRGAGPEARTPDSERPPDPRVMNQIEQLAARGVPVLVVVGEVDKCLADLHRPEAASLHAKLTTPGNGMELVIVPGSVHTFRDQDVVDAVVDIVVGWSERIASTLP